MSEVSGMSSFYEAGREAYNFWKPDVICPFEPGSDAAREWQRGFQDESDSYMDWLGDQ